MESLIPINKSSMSNQQVVSSLSELGFKIVGFTSAMNCESGHVYSNGIERIVYYINNQKINLKLGNLNASVSQFLAINILKQRLNEHPRAKSFLV